MQVVARRPGLRVVVLAMSDFRELWEAALGHAASRVRAPLNATVKTVLRTPTTETQDYFLNSSFTILYVFFLSRNSVVIPAT